MVICLERGAGCLRTVHLIRLPPKTPSSLASFKSRLVFFLSGTGLPKLSWKKRPLNGSGSSRSTFFISMTDKWSPGSHSYLSVCLSDVVDAAGFPECRLSCDGVLHKDCSLSFCMSRQGIINVHHRGGAGAAGGASSTASAFSSAFTSSTGSSFFSFRRRSRYLQCIDYDS